MYQGNQEKRKRKLKEKEKGKTEDLFILIFCWLLLLEIQNLLMRILVKWALRILWKEPFYGIYY